MAEMFRRKIKFHFYRVALQGADASGNVMTKGPYNLFQWIQEMNSNRLHYITLSDCTVYFENVSVSGNPSDPIYICRVFKLRNDNIPSKIKEGHESEAIPLEDDEYIGEDSFFLYDRINDILMFQQNRESIGIRRFQEWINQSVSLNSGESVALYPICDNVNASRFMGKEIKSLAFTLGTLDLDNESASFEELIKRGRKYKANVIKVTLTVGRSRRDQLDSENALELIKEIQSAPESFSNAKVSYRGRGDGDKSRTEIIDLLDNNRHAIIEIDVESKKPLNFERMKNAMFALYKAERNAIVRQVGKL